jgi:CheY-like chemotaxis protein
MAEPSAKPRLLLVDDDPDYRSLGRRSLESAGYELVEASDGREAFDYLLDSIDSEPSCILLDMAMPGMTGWDFLHVRSLYARLARIPVIVLSAHPPRVSGLPEVPLAWLQKPQSWDVVVELLKSYVKPLE